jgi:hypothetical protein
MARHDDREGVSRQSLSHSASCTSGAGPLRKLAVGHGRPERNGARGVVDAAMERRQTIHVEGDRREIGWRATQKPGNSIPRPRQFGWRHRLPRAGKPLEHAAARHCLVSFGQLQAHDAANAPNNRALADRRVEQGKRNHHDGLARSMFERTL